MAKLNTDATFALSPYTDVVMASKGNSPSCDADTSRRCSSASKPIVTSSQASSSSTSKSNVVKIDRRRKKYKGVLSCTSGSWNFASMRPASDPVEMPTSERSFVMTDECALTTNSREKSAKSFNAHVGAKKSTILEATKYQTGGIVKAAAAMKVNNGKDTSKQAITEESLNKSWYVASVGDRKMMLKSTNSATELDEKMSVRSSVNHDVSACTLLGNRKHGKPASTPTQHEELTVLARGLSLEKVDVAETRRSREMAPVHNGRAAVSSGESSDELESFLDSQREINGTDLVVLSSSDDEVEAIHDRHAEEEKENSVGTRGRASRCDESAKNGSRSASYESGSGVGWQDGVESANKGVVEMLVDNHDKKKRVDATERDRKISCGRLTPIKRRSGQDEHIQRRV